MKHAYLTTLFFANAAFPAVAAETDLLKAMIGCFDVSYRYIEDAAHPGASLAQRERIVLVDGAGGGVKLQHYFLQGDQLVTHWREEWAPLGGGVFRQSVFAPDNSLQYACAARFNGAQWRCAVPSTPKPRRDQSRTDYALLDRDSTLQITPLGFTQSERNDKRGSDGGFVAAEIGWNEYTKLAEDECPDANP